MRLANVVSANVLTELIQRPSLDLYAKERTKAPIKHVIQQVRARDLRIETMGVSGSGATESLRISFEYPDREKAQAMVRAVVTLLVEGTLLHPGGGPGETDRGIVATAGGIGDFDATRTGAEAIGSVAARSAHRNCREQAGAAGDCGVRGSARSAFRARRAGDAESIQYRELGVDRGAAFGAGGSAVAEGRAY